MADTPNKKPTVASPSSAYLRMAPRWRMIDVLLGGTEAMRVLIGLAVYQIEAVMPDLARREFVDLVAKVVQ